MNKEKNFYVIKARRWFDKPNGNTYHSAEVIKNGESIGKVPYTYGYGSHYEQTALEILEKIGEVKEKEFHHLWQWIESIGKENVYIDLQDVRRKKDL